MPSDESIDQHNKKRAEEIADVDKDRNSPEGLFKGTFMIRPLAELLYDESDGVLRCPHCQHEHEGGPLCTICGTRFEEGYDDDDPYGFSDLDDDAELDLDLEDLEVDVDGEYHAGHFHHFLGIPHFPFGGPAHAHFHHMHHHHHDESLGEESDSDIDRDSEDDEEDDDDDDEGSLQDFVVRDGEPNHNRGRNNRQPITISDDESDEGGPVAPRRRHPNRPRAALSSSPSAPSVLTVTDSENGETNAEADMLRNAGWSPLDTENESDAEEPIQYAYRGYGTTEDEQNSDDESDTNTMRNEASDDEDDHSRNDISETPTYQYNGATYMYDEGTPNSYAAEDEDDHAEAEFPHSMDRDGDTEMSASPGPSNLSRSVSVSTNGYRYDMDGEGEVYGYDDEGTPRGHRGVSISTDSYGDMGENLGVANEIHTIEDDSSDGSIQPPLRRRPRQRLGNPRVFQTDPRISMMFAEHQLSLRGAQNQQGLDDFEAEVRRAEPGSRNRRMASYRLQPPRRIDPLRSSRSPSATRIISSSNRIVRPPRQYQRRYH